MALCVAHTSRTGLPCKRHAIRGGTVCPSHGGRAPQVARKAASIMLGLRDKGMAEMDMQLTAHEVPPNTVLALVVGLTKTVAEMAEHEASAESGSAVDDYLESLKESE